MFGRALQQTPSLGIEAWNQCVYCGRGRGIDVHRGLGGESGLHDRGADGGDGGGGGGEKFKGAGNPCEDTCGDRQYCACRNGFETGDLERVQSHQIGQLAL